MKRAFVNVDVFGSSNMTENGNIDFRYWFNKTLEEKLAASVTMIEASFNTKEFVKQKVDRKVLSSYKRAS
jgi:hypothetical protein